MTTVLNYALISSDVYEDRPGSVPHCHHVPVPRAKVYCSTEHFFGAAYVAPQATGVIAFRGSWEPEDWVSADTDIARNLWPTDQLGNAFGFFSDARATLQAAGCKRFVVVGHSLGGGLAAVVAARVRRGSVRGVTFNAPGMASCRFAGSLADDRADATLKRALHDTGKLLAQGNPIAIGAALVSGLEAAKKITRKTAEAVMVDAKVKLDIPLENSHDVFNFRSERDVVSGIKGNHIGRVYTIKGAGMHPMGPLIERLKQVPEGGWRI